jgi:hypothetical protein
VNILCGLAIGPDEKLSGRADLYTKTDAEGHFTVGGLVAGSRCTVRAWDATGQGDSKQVPLVLAWDATGQGDSKQVPLVLGGDTIDLGDVVFDAAAQ